MSSTINTPNPALIHDAIHISQDLARDSFSRWTEHQKLHRIAVQTIGEWQDNGKFWSIAVQSEVDTAYEVLVDDTGKITTTVPISIAEFRKERNAAIVAKLSACIFKEFEQLNPSPDHIDLGQAKSIFGRWSEKELETAKYFFTRICNWRDYGKAWCVTVYTTCGVYDALIYDNGSVMTYGFTSSENFRPLTHEQVLLFPAVRSPYAAWYEYKPRTP